MEISQTALFLGSIIDLYCLVLILRVWLPLATWIITILFLNLR